MRHPYRASGPVDTRIERWPEWTHRRLLQGIWLATVAGFGGLVLKACSAELPPEWKPMPYEVSYTHQLVLTTPDAGGGRP